MFLGRAWPRPGEPLFLPEDTEAALALAEEERDTCHACGMPKAWCRDNSVGRARFGVDESFCWAVYAVNSRRDTNAWQKKNKQNHDAYTLFPKINPGFEPNVTAGLDLGR